MFTMKITDQFGMTHDESCWDLAAVNIDLTSMSGIITFAGWIHAKAKAEGKRPVAIKQYEVKDFRSYFDNLDGVDLSVVAKRHALKTEDVPSDKGLVSFFATAEQCSQ